MLYLEKNLLVTFLSSFFLIFSLCFISNISFHNLHRFNNYLQFFLSVFCTSTLLSPPFTEGKMRKERKKRKQRKWEKKENEKRKKRKKMRKEKNLKSSLKKMKGLKRILWVKNRRCNFRKVTNHVCRNFQVYALLFSLFHFLFFLSSFSLSFFLSISVQYEYVHVCIHTNIHTHVCVYWRIHT